MTGAPSMKSLIEKTARRAPWVKLAFLAPAMLLLGAGLNLWIEHARMGEALQRAARDGLDAAASAADEASAQRLARAAVDHALQQSHLRTDAADVLLLRGDSELTLQLAYDDADRRGEPLAKVIPTPPSSIVRIASLHLGGR
ncbi:MAG: hypothetical protein Q8M88_08720 [Phenylobacterium sp.]|uniref:hypothetical protein n=1 Tax=Phenylobacterium sp. TaxID=1871053 RepID=UPI00273691D5|nr:hypothetical protein [Phenylobacterium sp.]MDP3174501.1 hypothetical protein [Phenylobacterium sp.]